MSQGYEDECGQKMTKLIELVRGDLAKVQRCTLEALVVIEVHNRDVVTVMISEECQEVNNFSWLAQMRYYWEVCTSVRRSAIPPAQRPASCVLRCNGFCLVFKSDPNPK